MRALWDMQADKLLSEFFAGYLCQNNLEHQDERNKQHQPDNDNNDPDHHTPFSGCFACSQNGPQRKNLFLLNACITSGGYIINF